MIKTEHNGAKNGGGFWGYRQDAKEVSNYLRRVEDRRLEKEANKSMGGKAASAEEWD